MFRRRSTEIFSLSFLDCICCGFGAVVLFYMIMSSRAGSGHMQVTENLQSEVRKLEDEVLAGTRDLVVLRNTLEKTESDAASASSRATRLIEELQKARDQGTVYDGSTLARREHIEKLKADIRALDEANRRLEAGSKDVAPPGTAVKALKGGSNRRYITGLQLRGKRVLVLMDASASMLSDDVVDVIRLRNSSEENRRAAQKWRRGVAVVGWLSSQIAPGSKFQVYTFNTQPKPLIEGTDGDWLNGGDEPTVDKLLENLDSIVPQDGTSLINAFQVIRRMNPAPDQIILITDGMPTQGANPPALRKYIDAGGRARLFDEATRALPPKTPIDVVLLPMLGDNPAAHAYWRLARNSGGAYLIPSKDWP